MLAAPAAVVKGHEVLGLVEKAGGRCSIGALRVAAAERFGEDAVFGNCHGRVFDFDQLLAFLESAGKVAVRGGFVALGPVPACSGH